MGFRISWLAAQGVARDEMLRTLSLADTNEPDEANEAPFSVATLPNDWTIVCSNDEAYGNDARAAGLSRRCSHVLAVHVNETCMHCTVSSFRSGARQWRIHHEGDERPDVLEVDGEPPAQFAAIKAEARAAQAAEDADRAEVDWIFDVPLKTAEMVCGFKHDQGRYDWGEPAFTIAKPEASAAKTGSSRAFAGLRHWVRSTT